MRKKLKEAHEKYLEEYRELKKSKGSPERLRYLQGLLDGINWCMNQIPKARSAQVIFNDDGIEVSFNKQ